ncbi:MAG: alpha/beta fold hydrolase [Vulcanimicrobiaceae bacterium]
MGDVIGGGGTKLHVVDTGNPRGTPLVFVHGYCQSSGSWMRQVESDLGRDFRLVAFDLRGHGRSDKPEDPEAYKDPSLWADDLRGVLETLDVRRSVLVAWSYAGRLIGDYLRAYGTERVSAIAFVAAVTRTGKQYSASPFDELFPDVFSDDPATIGKVLQKFVTLCFARGFALDPRVAAEILAAEKVVPRIAREAMLKRGKLDYDDVLRALEVPVLCTHGASDDVVLRTSSEHIVKVVPNAKLSIYTGVGHSPFYEAPLRFNRELAEFASSLSSRA